MYFAYGETELAYLRKKDKRLCEVIDRLGPVSYTHLTLPTNRMV